MNKRITPILIIGFIALGLSLVFYFGFNNSSDSTDVNNTLITENEGDLDNVEESSSPNIIAILIMVLVPIGITLFAFKGLFKHLAGGRDRNRILKTGRPAKAKIIELGESGRGIVTINDQPFVKLKLEVYDGNKAPYQVEIKTVIARLDVPKFQPGTELAIKIDPQDPNKIAFDSKGEYFQNNLPIYGKKYSKEDREIMKNKGIEAKAKIISVEDTGESKDFKPVIKMIYEVQREGRSPYTLTKKIPTSTETVKIIKSFIGKTVSAKVHPNDSNKVELKFNP